MNTIFARNNFRRYMPLLLPMVLSSFILSLLLLVGRIDQDFFEFYYEGRALLWGKAVFADTAANKGPLIYFFYGLLYGIFGHAYGAALVVASTILDAGIAFVMIFVTQSWIGFSLPRSKRYQGLLAVLVVTIVKSFSINSLQGGVYSEQVGVILLLISLLFVEKKYFLPAGIVFAAALLARQSLLSYVLVIGVRLLTRKEPFRAWLYGGAGSIVVLGSTVIVLWYTNQLYWAYENMVLSVQWYSQAIAGEKWPLVLWTILRESRLLFGMICVILVSLRCRQIWKDIHLRWLVPAVCISGMYSVFGGGVAWDHHYLQMAPLFFLCYFMIWHYAPTDYVLQMSFIGVLCFTVLSYARYSVHGVRDQTHLINTIPPVSEIKNKRYLLVYPYYPRLYINYDRESPDRYYDPSFSLNPRYFGAHVDLHTQRHLTMPKDRLRQTAFVFLSSSNKSLEKARQEYQWYLDTFGEPFQLVYQARYMMGTTRIEIYGSRE